MNRSADTSIADTNFPAGDGQTPSAAGGHLTYTPGMQAIHWCTALLLLSVYAVAWTIDKAPDPADQAWLTMTHQSLGLTILLLTAMRLVVRPRSRIPPLPAGLPMVQNIAARISAFSLYLSLATQPLLGLVASLADGDRIVLFGGFALPRPLQDRRLAHMLFQMHGVAGSIFLGMIGLHAAAALYHHFIRKDRVLASMLPGVPMAGGGPARTPGSGVP